MGIVRAPSWRAYGAADESAARSYRAADESAARRSVIPSPLLFIDLIYSTSSSTRPRVPALQPADICGAPSGSLGGS